MRVSDIRVAVVRLAERFRRRARRIFAALDYRVLALKSRLISASARRGWLRRLWRQAASLRYAARSRSGPLFRAFISLLVLAATATAHADVFKLSGGDVSLQFVAVGDPGNAADTHWTGDPYDQPARGGVTYAYAIAKCDVTSAQYCQFLNAVAATDTYQLYGLDMASPSVSGGCGIVRSGTSGSYTYSVVPDSGVPGQSGYANYANFPVNYVTWGSAVRFCNWLQNGQPTGAEGSGTTETGAYTLNGAMTAPALMAVTRNAGAIYVLPSVDEYYKAAYYKSGGANAGYWLYPTQNDTAPINILSATGTNNANFNDHYGTGNGGFTDPINYFTAVGTFAGSPGPYGTYDMGGDVYQWDETVVTGRPYRGIWGGDYGSPSDNLRSSSAGSWYSPASSSRTSASAWW